MSSTKQRKNFIRLNLAECSIKVLELIAKEALENKNQSLINSIGYELKERPEENYYKVSDTLSDIVVNINDSELVKSFIGKVNDLDICIAKKCKDSSVLEELYNTTKNPQVIIYLSSNKYFDLELLKKLIEKYYYIKEIFEKCTWSAMYNTSVNGIFSRHDLTKEIMWYIAKNQSEDILVNLAAYENTPKEILQFLLDNFTNKKLITWIATHKNADSEIIRKILKSNSLTRNTISEIINNNIVDEDVLIEMIRNNQVGEEEYDAALENSNTGDKYIQFLFDEAKQYDLIVAKRNEKTSADILLKVLLLENGEEYARRIASHPNANDDVFNFLLEHYFEEEPVLENIIRNSNVSIAVLDKIAMDALNKDFWSECENIEKREMIRELIYKVRIGLG